MKFRQWLENNWQNFPRQRLFSWMHEPGYNRKPDIGKEETHEDYLPQNIYHVTSNLAKVIASGRLKSRSELGVSGLGGGPKNESPRTISATYDYNRALSIYHEFKYVLSIVRGAVKPSQIWSSFESNNHQHEFFNGDDGYDDMQEGGQAVWDLLLQYGVSQQTLESGDDPGPELDTHVKHPKDIYEFYQECENVFLDMGQDHDQASPMNVIGFTADYATMKRIDPNQLAILQLAIKKGANFEHVANELEIRVAPEDVAIVRYITK